ncbi:MAG TPA: glutamine-hydrolyzing carbamoyl-phosphate synthase small subunit [Clostridia bacterium]|nr:glutamine-hydrolyzing carbamoyl-phosphate synthase small subunit [Clostridia bacterium]
MNKKIVFEDGTEFCGYGFGYDVEKVLEIVFNTTMVGYQEIISNPVYTDKMMLMTYPLIGNCGIVDEDFEAKNTSIGGLIVREYNDSPSNFRYSKTLEELLEENQIPAIEGVDTRKMFKKLRDEGLGKVIITDISTTKEDAVKKIKETVIEGNYAQKMASKRWYARTSKHTYNVLAIDCGLKKSEIKALNDRSCNITIMPWTITDEEIRFINPDGIYITNGPGKVEEATIVVEKVKKLIGKYPIGGTGLGCQIIASAFGAKTDTMKLGHHGFNHPVKNLTNGKIETTNQSHSYTINADSILNTNLKITHINLLDNTIEGIASIEDKVVGVEFQPVLKSSGENINFYDEFINLMRGVQNA